MDRRSSCLQLRSREKTKGAFYIHRSVMVLTAIRFIERYWSFGGYYLRRQNSGSISTVDFYSNEAGVRTTIKF